VPDQDRKLPRMGNALPRLARTLVSPLRRDVSRRFDQMVETLSRRIDHSRVVYCGGHEVLTRVRNGRRIYLDMRDTAVAPMIALGQDYEPDVAAALREVAHPGDNFFDVGANFGYHSLLLAPLLANGSHALHLFEPNPDVFRCLRRTIHANGMWSDVTLNQIALSDHPGTAPLSVFEDFWGGATLGTQSQHEASEHPWAEYTTVEQTVEIPTTTLDEYCAQHGVESIDLMKIDTEGHEEAVFSGMRQVIDRSPDLRIVLEFTFGAYTDPARFWEQLTSDFPHRFFVSRQGALDRVGDLEELGSKTDFELVNVVLSRVPIPSR